MQWLPAGLQQNGLEPVADPLVFDRCHTAPFRTRSGCCFHQAARTIRRCRSADYLAGRTGQGVSIQSPTEAIKRKRHHGRIPAAGIQPGVHPSLAYRVQPGVHPSLAYRVQPGVHPSLAYRVQPGVYPSLLLPKHIRQRIKPRQANNSIKCQTDAMRYILHMY